MHDQYKKLIYNGTMRRYNDACAKEGYDVCKITRLEWKKSSYILFFNIDGSEHHINISESCRAFCGRLNVAMRQKIEESMPEEIGIETQCIQFFNIGAPYNFGYRTVYKIDYDDLKKWLTKAANM